MLTRRGIRNECIKEGLTFTEEDSPMAHLMLSVMGAFAEFERALGVNFNDLFQIDVSQREAILADLQALGDDVVERSVLEFV